MAMLYPMLGLLGWTVLITVNLFAERIFIVLKSPNLQVGRHVAELHKLLPEKHRNTTENYNHLHEQPVIFYAICVYIHLAGTADSVAVALAWIYVVARIVHSAIQTTFNTVAARFAVFIIGTLCTSALIVREIAAVLIAS